MTQIVTSVAVSVMTAAVLGIFVKVSDLAETSAKNQVRLETVEKDIADSRSDTMRNVAAIDDTRLDLAKLRATYEEWARKNRRIDRGG